MVLVPQDIVWAILRDVPVKDLLRFKCVSKEWCSIINHPYFFNLHLHRSLNRHDLCVIVTERSISTSKLLSLDSNSVDLDNSRILNHPLKLPREDDNDGHNILLIGSCNGLVCLVNERSRETALWNISTREYRVVPDVPVERTKVVFPLYGLGHDSINDDYKLVRIVRPEARPIVNEIVVYSLRTNTWRRGEDISYDFIPNPHFKRLGTFVCGALHWVMALNWDAFKYPNKTSIAAFDVGTEKYRRIKLLGNMRCNPLVLGALGGCLCVTQNTTDCKVNVWSMRDYGVKDSWTLLFSFRTGNITGYNLRPLTYSKTRDKLLFESKIGNLIWHDLKDDELNTYKKLDVRFHSIEIYVESLVQFR